MDNFEETVRKDLHAYLHRTGLTDERMPETDDIGSIWQGIATAYLPDGVREYAGYPCVSLGWAMYIGMAVAAFWDSDWESYRNNPDIYAELKAARGFDRMDEYIREEILGLKDGEYDRVEMIVGECAARTDSILHHSGIEAGSKEAFNAYLACLHQMYLAGAAFQLSRMGYSMTKVSVQ